MYPTDLAGIIGLWAAFILMLFIYSYPLYKENPAFRFAEHTFIGTTFAITIITSITAFRNVGLTPLLNGNIILIIPMIIGLMLYTIFSPKYRWMSKWSMGFLIGIGIGMGIRGVLMSSVLAQVISTITPPPVYNAMTIFNFIFEALGFLFCVSYFLLTYEHKGIAKYPTKIGRILIMLALGAMFANTTQFRLAMLSSRVQFLLQVLKIIPM